ncbi:MAG TPA: type II secretion system protein GspG [Verrucomicrobiales bacterium]|nr:type II secretion system protein GspG [Verrucomicrobiales bacterium]
MQLPKISSGGRVSRSGFTLIELMTVVTIIAVLAGIMLAVISAATNSARRKQARIEIEAMTLALDRYKVEFGEYPAVAGGSGNPETMAKCLYQALSGDGSDMIDGVTDGASSTGEAGSATGGLVFLDTAIYDRDKVRRNNRGFVHGNYYLQDPFGQPYHYKRAGEGVDTQNPTYDLWSLGTDKTGDNPESWITNWQ